MNPAMKSEKPKEIYPKILKNLKKNLYFANRLVYSKNFTANFIDDVFFKI